MKTYRQQALEAFASIETALDDMFNHAPVFIPHETKLTGSLAVGTDIPEEKPDIDVFVLTLFPVKAYQLAQVYFHKGHEKKGELLIWHLPSYTGFEIDLVFENPDHLKTETVKHTDYFKEHLTPEAKKDTIELKRLAKKYNLYGAEVGGITGVACTMIAMKRDERRRPSHSYVSSINFYLHHYGFDSTEYGGAKYIIDPVIPDRCLTANIADFKKERAEFRLARGLSITLDGEFKQKILVKRKEEGTDREFQRIASALAKARRMLCHEYKHWNPIVTYDTWVEANKTTIGYHVKHDELIFVWKEIPSEVLTKDIKLQLANSGKLACKCDEYGENFEYFYVHKNPHLDITPSERFEQLFGEALT